MTMMFKVAKNELRNLFYSPVAWFLTIAFMVQCALFYTGMIAGFAKLQEMMQQNSPGFTNFDLSFTATIFLSGDGIFSNVMQNLYLFVPLLTMALISREINNGTIKLLFSSPLKTRDIVLGKFLAVMAYNLLLVLVLGIFMVSACFNIKDAEAGMLFSAALGFFLVVCVYTAIGLFMSSLTNYQIVSAIGSFMLVFALSRIGGLWQQYDFVREITYFLSISGRAAKMLKGLITTNDVIYFIAMMFLFVSFTYLKLRGGREIKPWYVKLVRYLAVLLMVLATGYISTRPGLIGYWDLTRNQLNTLHPNTQKVVKAMGKEKLTITLYCNLLGEGANQGFPVARNQYMWDLWEPYLRFKPDIEFKYVYYYDVKDGDSGIYKQFPNKSLRQIAAMMADGLEEDFSKYLAPEEIRKQVDLSAENYRLIMKADYQGRSAFLRTYNDNVFWPQEMQVAPVFKRLVEGKGPEVLYVTGNLERNIYKGGEREYSGHSTYKGNRFSLVNLGFDFDTIAPAQQEIPQHISSLVLADPKTTLSPLAQERISKYISNGGNMMILGEPGKQQMLNPVLQQLGITIMDGTLVQLSKNEMPNMVTPYIPLANTDLAEEHELIKLKKGKGKDTLQMLTPGVSPLSYIENGNWMIRPIELTQPGKTWLKKGPLVVDSAAPVFNAQAGDLTMNSFPVMLRLTRNFNEREQRIVVCGDADWLSNVRNGGYFLSRALFSWLDYNEFPIYTPRPPEADSLVTISQSGAKALRIAYVWVLPAIILIAGTLLLIRRKRQ